ncbi:hypothetical protein QDT91_28935 (plasmid) [Mycolicibacterium aubagnense]|nr:hypothetical protein [Mycolicibacterium aubagnense]WGI36083.1 hypothetical protein QDT91_28935 [Mycolicibacterium aubagnense]
MPVRQVTHHLGPDPTPPSCGGHLDKLDLQPLVAELRDVLVVRVDAARIVELDAGHLDAVREHLNEPGLAAKLPVPPVRMLVGDCGVEWRRPRPAIGGPAAVVDQFEVH